MLSDLSRQEIQWWLDNVKLKNGKLIRQTDVDCWVETDASLEGWGAKFNEKQIGGRWSRLESLNHINYLELLAIFFTLRAFFSKSTNVHIGIKSDNITAVAYVNDMGGMISEVLDKLSIEIWNWCQERNIFLTAQYVPGIENQAADFMSRHFSDSSEWKLKPEIFSRICSHFFIPDIDLFASRLNCQIQNFASWMFDPQASYTDAFTLSWSDFTPYIFPPFSLIGKIIDKVLHDKVAKAIIIVPFWPTQNWFSLLLSVLISLPARLPRHGDLLTLPHTGDLHPLRRKLNLIACTISGKDSCQKEFQEMLPQLLSPRGDSQQSSNMNSIGPNGYFGVVNKTVIPFTRLKRTL